MENAPILSIVGARCRPEEDSKFNNWYSDVHIPMLMKYDGLRGVERFKLMAVAPDYPQYLTVYHYANRQALAGRQTWAGSPEVAENIKANWPNGLDITLRAVYFELKKWSANGNSTPAGKPVIHIVGVNGPSPEKDTEFNRWYDTTHVPWLMKTGTIAETVRARAVQDSKDYPAYLAIYYFDDRTKYEEFSTHPERLAAVKELNEHWPSGIGTTWRMQYELIKG